MSDNVLDIFQPAVDLSGSASVMPGLVESLEAHVLPESADFYARLAWAFLMMMMGSVATESPLVWKWYIVSYSVALFPAFAAFITQGTRVNTVNDATVKVLARLGKTLDVFMRVSVAKEDNGRADGAQIIAEINTIIGSFHVIGRFGNFGNNLWQHPTAANIQTIYGHYSLVVFLAGKIINDENRKSVTEARPRAIISKYNLGVDGHQFFLNHGAILSNYAHSGIWSAWMEMPFFRQRALYEIVKAVSTGAHLANDVMNVTVSLMEWTNLQHATFCARLIAQFPWIETFEPLRTSYSEFMASRKAIKAYPREIIPFLKLIYGDRVKLFARPRLLPLIECALSIFRETEPSLAQYYSDPSQAATVALFRAEVNRRRLITEAEKSKQLNQAVDGGRPGTSTQPAADIPHEPPVDPGTIDETETV